MLELWVLGKCKLWIAGQALTLPPKRLALMVYLALEGEGRRNLRQELHRLKQTPLAPLLELTPKPLD